MSSSKGKGLAMRQRDPSASEAVIEIHSVPLQNGVIIKVSPPVVPLNQELDHVPCDIVLVIDVSGSMGMDAPVPTNPGEPEEHNGLCVLDLVKHASLTILESLNEGDRLGVVTFATEAKVLQKLMPMTPENKVQAKANIRSMQPTDQTNLWHGLMESIKLFGSKTVTGRVPAIMILTDGCPNHMEPAQGYIPKLRSKKALPATIHTFGFGYQLRSGLLQSLAEFGNGNYAFIPDAGMIGTVFVHAVANLQATFANNATIQLTYPESIKLEQTMGAQVGVQEPSKGKDARTELRIPLGNIQYGQSRDVFLRYAETPWFASRPETNQEDDTEETTDRSQANSTADESEDDDFAMVDESTQVQQKMDLDKKVNGEESADSDEDLVGIPMMTATLTYQWLTSPVQKSVAECNLLEPSTTLTDAETAYHISRAIICSFIASLFPLRWDAEHDAVDYSVQHWKDLTKLIKQIPAARFADDVLCASLMEDLSGPSPKGQINLALSQLDFYTRWGVHYLPSLANAHVRQICNSFKDPGPLQYGTHSPLFTTCRDRLDDLFDTLPAPAPSDWTVTVDGHTYSYSGTCGTTTGPVSMGGYNRSSNPCFAGFCRVQLADGTQVRVGRLRAGALVATPRGARRVVAVLKTRVRREPMVRLPGSALLVTAWHPVRRGEGAAGEWVFPGRVAPRRRVRYTGSIYSVLLQRDADAEAHAVRVGGVWGVTLGHGVVREGEKGGGDVRAHRFLGDYRAVVRSLAALGMSRQGVVLGGGVRRDGKTGRVCGFAPPSRVQVRRRELDRILRKVIFA